MCVCVRVSACGIIREQKETTAPVAPRYNYRGKIMGE